MMENLSFSVEEGDFVSIIGASGCGKKSTIFRLINGLEQLQKGRDSGERKAHPRAEAIQCIYAAEGFAFFHGGRLRKKYLFADGAGRCACGGTGEAVQGC